MCKHIEEPHQICHTTQLTFDELKDAAEKLGYNLVKKKEYIPLKPCPICGKSVLRFGIQCRNLEAILENARTANLKAVLLQRKEILIKLGTMLSIDI